MTIPNQIRRHPRSRLIGAVALCASMVIAASAGADALLKWKTPVGGIYFGSAPPKGSVLASGSESPLAMRERSTAIREKMDQAAADRHEALASAVEVAPYTTRRDGFYWLLNGTVRNVSKERIHGVEVGAKGIWASVEPRTIEPGEQAAFSLRVPIPEGTGRSDLAEVEARWFEKSMVGMR